MSSSAGQSSRGPHHPEPSILRKAAIASGVAEDHAGKVEIAPIPGFSLEGTIFDSLKGRLERFVMKSRIGTEPHWNANAAETVEAAYQSRLATRKMPEIAPELIRFLEEECDFDVEHAEGSFFDHLYFGYEYALHHYPEESALVMFLHSVLGTGTNTFAMKAEKIPKLRSFLNSEEWTQIAAFPSILRLLYDMPLRRELTDNLHRLGEIDKIDFYRVIDNEPMSLSGPEFLIQLNFQLIHLIDFLPAANWSVHSSDTSFVLFRSLYDILVQSKNLKAQVSFSKPGLVPRLRGEKPSLHLVQTLIPAVLSERMAARAVKNFSRQIGHQMDYELHFL